MKVGFFVGCNTAFNRPDLEAAVRRVMPGVGIELDDLAGQSCCPTWATMPSIDTDGWCAVSARNLCLAEEKGLDLVTVCGSCYGSLSETRHRMAEDHGLKDRVNEILAGAGRTYRGTAAVFQAVYLLHRELGPDGIARAVHMRLNGLTVAVQPGCHSLWPSEIYPLGEADPFHPVVLREMCEALGAAAPSYSRLTDCCGMGGMRSTDMEKSFALAAVKLRSMREEIRPDLIVTGCSSCLIQLDTCQGPLQQKGVIDFEIPVLHYMQLLALCLGAAPEEVTGLARTDVGKIVGRIRRDVNA